MRVWLQLGPLPARPLRGRDVQLAATSRLRERRLARLLTDGDLLGRQLQLLVHGHAVRQRLPERRVRRPALGSLRQRQLRRRGLLRRLPRRRHPRHAVSMRERDDGLFHALPVRLQGAAARRPGLVHPGRRPMPERQRGQRPLLRRLDLRLPPEGPVQPLDCLAHRLVA